MTDYLTHSVYKYNAQNIAKNVARSYDRVVLFKRKNISPNFFLLLMFSLIEPFSRVVW